MTEPKSLRQLPAEPATAGSAESVVADYTESVVPAEARRSNFRMLLGYSRIEDEPAPSAAAASR